MKCASVFELDSVTKDERVSGGGGEDVENGGEGSCMADEASSHPGFFIIPDVNPLVQARPFAFPPRESSRHGRISAEQTREGSSSGLGNFI